jgi:two-component system chemotaxis sensor kinase CheA
MAIVREKVLKLGGAIAIDSREGQGTTFRIVLPVTVATFKGILVQAGGQSFVIPVASTERIKRFRRQDIKTVEGRETVDLDGRIVAFASLADVLELPRRSSDARQDYVECVILGSGEGRIAFAVDAVLNEQEVLVKSLGAPLLRVRNIAAATVLGSGTPVLILNAADLLQSAVRAASTSRYAPAPEADGETKTSRILVADDSVTSRMLIKNVLETSGYAVETASDGLESLTSLRNREFDLLVSDVEMPRMNGFELTSSVRADGKLNEMPVVLVTALSSREDKVRGIDAGANAYIVKGSFDQSDLLSVISKLI